MIFNLPSKKGYFFYSLYLIILFLFLFTNQASAHIPFRVSIKFIVDSNGNRPAFGNFNTTAEANAETDSGNDILQAMFSELRIQVTEIVDLPTSLSSYSTISVSKANMDSIRALALADQSSWKWRTNAVNVYVTGGTGSAYASFPQVNNIILFGQNCSNNPSCLLHELGHTLNLLHTHQGGGADGCGDTLNDNSSWSTKDQMANSNYGLNYNQLNVLQKTSVDMTWSNFMSYHTGSPQVQFTPCQKDRASSTASSDSSWWLAVTPRYVHPINSITCTINFFTPCNGTWARPYATLQNALDGSGLSGKAIVLEKGNHLIIQGSGINANVDIFTRQGISRVDRGALLYELPANVEKSKNLAVKDAVKQAQREATLARKALKEGEKNAKSVSDKERKNIEKLAKQKNKEHKANAVAYLLEAERYAIDREKHAIQMELAQRYWHSKNYPLCLEYYSRVAEDSDQIHLKEKALMHASQCQNKLTPTSVLESSE